MFQGIFGADGVFLDMMGSRLGFIQKFYILFDFPSFDLLTDGTSPPFASSRMIPIIVLLQALWSSTYTILSFSENG